MITLNQNLENKIHTLNVKAPPTPNHNECHINGKYWIEWFLNAKEHKPKCDSI
jgi:hypothetical protein